MVKIHVVPSEVITYGNTATERFGDIVGQLKNLTTMVDGVVFEGVSAARFRTETNDLVQDFNSQIHLAMSGMIGNVSTAVGNIQASMGGERLNLTIPTDGGVERAREDSTENSEMDTDDLAGLDVEGPFQAITDSFLAHQTALNGVTWEGNQANMARDAVQKLTDSATDVCSTYSDSLRKAITAQVGATLEADNKA